MCLCAYACGWNQGIIFGFSIVVMSQGPVAQALFLGDQTLFNTTRDDCVWKRGNDRDSCPDEDISMTLYTSTKTKTKVKCRMSAKLAPNNNPKCVWRSLVGNRCKKTCATNEPSINEYRFGFGFFAG